MIVKEIRAAKPSERRGIYKKMLLSFHPDKRNAQDNICQGRSDAEAGEVFMEIKRRYDESLRESAEEEQRARRHDRVVKPSFRAAAAAAAAAAARRPGDSLLTSVRRASFTASPAQRNMAPPAQTPVVPQKVVSSKLD